MREYDYALVREVMDRFSVSEESAEQIIGFFSSRENPKIDEVESELQEYRERADEYEQKADALAERVRELEAQVSDLEAEQAHHVFAE